MVLLAAGCSSPDTEAELDEFVEARSEFIPDGGALPDAGEGNLTSGRYFMAVSTVLMPPNELFLEVTVTVDESGDTANFVLQPLKTDIDENQSPRADARAAVGDAVTVNDVPIVDGGFEMDLGSVAIDGAANPITTGAAITAELVLIGVVVDDETFCGTVNGDVTSPIEANIDNSSFGSLKFDGDFVEIGEEFIARCPAPAEGDPAPDAGTQ